MRLLRKFWRIVRHYPGLCLLVLLLGFISAQTIKPGFYLMGWDNYSSYFNLPTNLFRTFFAAWRDYRGLGVASDAEVTDIFRQVFYWFSHFFLPEQLLDQVYYIAALWIGVLATYWCAGLLFADRLKKYISFLAGFFYLFNLNTLSIFYSPIIPFTNRFYSLPLSIAVFLWFIKKPRSLRRILLVLTTILVTSGSYVTPTIFFTSGLAIALFLWCRLNGKQSIVAALVFVGLNAFWLLPFVHYTIEKSPIIPLARTFIEINESTLNRPASVFSLQKQAILFPSFFDLHFDAINGKPWTIHPLFAEYEQPITILIFFFFPFLYILGSLFLLFSWKKNKHQLWIPLWIGVFLFLSTKEFGPLGFMYAWLVKIIPFFDVVFRISDTKFHAYISLAGSLAAAYALCVIISYLRSSRALKLFFTLCLFLAGIYIWPFRTFFTGDLIGFFSYVNLPQAYTAVAKIINQTSGHGRVLHLPMDTWHSYWRSFSWGYLGSSFFHFLINKPYIDKTFEPASMENTYLHEKINTLVGEFYRTGDPTQRKEVADQFLKLLQQTGIEYVLIDHSINPSVYVRNLQYTAIQPLSGSKELMEYLLAEGLVTQKSHYSITLDDLYGKYQGLYPVRSTGLPNNSPSIAGLTLYQIPGTVGAFRFLSSALNVDTKLGNLLETQLTSSGSNFIQDPQKPAVLVPFMRQNHRLIRQDSSFTLEYPLEISTTTYRLEIKAPALNSYFIDVYGKKVGQKLTLRLVHRYYPDINGKRFEVPIGSTTLPIRENTSLDKYRLKLNDLIIPLPIMLGENEASLVSFISHQPTVQFSLLTEDAVLPLSLSGCAGLGSTCFQASVRPPSNSLPSIVEFELRFKGSLAADVCVKEQGINPCLNQKRNLWVSPDHSTYRIPLLRPVSAISDLMLQIRSVNTDGSEKALLLESASEKIYQSIGEKVLTFVPEYPSALVRIEGPLRISIPKAKSPYSYLYDPKEEYFFTSSEPCTRSPSSSRFIRRQGDTTIHSVNDCSGYLAQQFEFAYGYPYLFAFDYRVESGQQPLIILGRKGDTLLMERASLYQGYPKAARLGMTSASRLIDPVSVPDTISTDMAIHLFQDTANEGVFAVGGFDMMEYPAAWHGLQLIPEGASVSYPINIDTFSYKQILPSLWSLQLGPKEGLLQFSEGYDRGWGIYKNMWDVLFGKSIERKHYSCMGYANCFELPTNIPSTTYYVFYWPERLSIMGWGITFFVFIATLIWMLCTRSSKTLTV